MLGDLVYLPNYLIFYIVFHLNCNAIYFKRSHFFSNTAIQSHSFSLQELDYLSVHSPVQPHSFIAQVSHEVIEMGEKNQKALS